MALTSLISIQSLDFLQFGFLGNFMDLRLAQNGLDIAVRNKRWFLLAAAVYGGFGVYHSPRIAKRRKQISQLLGALVSIFEAASDSAEAISVVSRDLKDFLKSESDQIPNSLKQISKIAKSDEIGLSIIKFTQALAVGLLRGYRSDTRTDDDQNRSTSFIDQIMDKLFTQSGSGFASAVVGTFGLLLGTWSRRSTPTGFPVKG